jgi:UDP-GlcNAc:undecaprenyl-phosphate GlcNAc-1-phosphate transferase
VGVLAASAASGAPGPVAGLVAGGALVFLAGAWEDWRGLSPWSRLTLQVVGACWAVFAWSRSPEAWPALTAVSGWLAAVAAVLWLVGMANAFNFIDGLDGLAPAVGAASAALLASRCGEAGALSAGLCGACLGFLPYNGYRAKVFLGDGGATLIGFLLAGLGLHAGRADGSGVWAAPLAALALPAADLVATTVSRVRRGEVRGVRSWVEFAGRDHLHHRLLDAGLPAPAAAALLTACHACAAAGLLLLAR